MARSYEPNSMRKLTVTVFQQEYTVRTAAEWRLIIPGIWAYISSLTREHLIF